MTRDDIIRMAKEAGAIFDNDDCLDGCAIAIWSRFAALVATEKDKQIARLRDENVYLVNFPRCSRCDSGEG